MFKLVLTTIFFLNGTATTEIYTSLHTLSLHDALPIFALAPGPDPARLAAAHGRAPGRTRRSEEHTSALQSRNDISYAVLCLKKKNTHVSMPLSCDNLLTANPGRFTIYT